MDIPPLQAKEITNKIDCNFIPYEHMDEIRSIEELLPKTLILYQLATVGHFVCIFKNKEGINFFDPLGFFPDHLLKHGAIAPDHDYTYLLKLLLDCNYNVIYNQYPLQKLNTATCGHWCGVRMFYSDLYCDEFYDLFKNVKNKDITIYNIFNNL